MNFTAPKTRLTTDTDKKESVLTNPSSANRGLLGNKIKDSLDKKRHEEENINSKFFFLRYKNLKIKKLNKFEKEVIIELFKDEENYGISLLFKTMDKSQKNIKDFFEIRDDKNRNLLGICAMFGHRGLFIDLLCVLNQ